MTGISRVFPYCNYHRPLPNTSNGRRKYALREILRIASVLWSVYLLLGRNWKQILFILKNPVLRNGVFHKAPAATNGLHPDYLKDMALRPIRCSKLSAAQPSARLTGKFSPVFMYSVVFVIITITKKLT